MPPALAVGGAAVLAALVALVRPHAVAAYAQQHTAFMVGALAIGALGVALAHGLVLVLRREPRRRSAVAARLPQRLLGARGLVGAAREDEQQVQSRFR